MSEMVEAVAAAILHELNSGGTPGRDPDRMNRVARAAIEAMREPDAKMLMAAAPFPMHLVIERNDPSYKNAQEAATLGDRAAARSMYQTMIDAALRQAGDGDER